VKRNEEINKLNEKFKKDNAHLFRESSLSGDSSSSANSSSSFGNFSFPSPHFISTFTPSQADSVAREEDKHDKDFLQLGKKEAEEDGVAKNLEEDFNNIVLESSSGSSGSGRNHQNGLWDYQLEKIMKRYPNFAGVYPSDKLNEIPVNQNTKRFGFIMNTDPSWKNGSHWVGVYIDKDKDNSLEYYDSFGNQPSKKFMQNIRHVISKLKPDTYLKFKVNRIVSQSANSSNCGIFAALFLTNRFEGYPFKECTKFNDVVRGEQAANKIRKEWTKFGYI